MLRRPKSERGQSEAHRRAPKQEKETARLIGGRTTPGSGSGYQKGDARRRGLLRVECKCTTGKGFRVTVEDLDKLEVAVHGTREIPVMQIELNTRDGGVPQRRRLYVISADAMEDLLERLADAA